MPNDYSEVPLEETARYMATVRSFDDLSRPDVPQADYFMAREGETFEQHLTRIQNARHIFGEALVEAGDSGTSMGRHALIFIFDQLEDWENYLIGQQGSDRV